jgi:hypothetical protein
MPAPLLAVLGNTNQSITIAAIVAISAVPCPIPETTPSIPDDFVGLQNRFLWAGYSSIHLHFDLHLIHVRLDNCASF